MKIPTQAGVNNYVASVIHYPFNNRKHLESMVILHYDIPDGKASLMVGKALVKLLAKYRRDAVIIKAQLNRLNYIIVKIEGFTPESNPDFKEDR